MNMQHVCMGGGGVAIAYLESACDWPALLGLSGCADAGGHGVEYAMVGLHGPLYGLLDDGQADAGQLHIRLQGTDARPGRRTWSSASRVEIKYNLGYISALVDSREDRAEDNIRITIISEPKCGLHSSFVETK